LSWARHRETEGREQPAAGRSSAAAATAALTVTLIGTSITTAVQAATNLGAAASFSGLAGAAVTASASTVLGNVGAVNRLAFSAITSLCLAAGGSIATWLGDPAVWIISGCDFLAVFLLNLPAIRSLEATDRDSPGAAIANDV